jgi:hypothetical protein
VDLSFTRFDRHTQLVTLPTDLAVLMVEMTARQAASPTATIYARSTRVRFDSALFAPLDGAFNGPMATAILRWKDE